MPSYNKPAEHVGRRLTFVLLSVLLGILWVAGGASRADVLGQVVVRFAAWAVVIVFVLFAPRPDLRSTAPVALILFGATALVIIQLIPLPPAVWLELPGRGLLAQSAIVSGQEQPWRPLSITPGATVNALSSLIVPMAALLLVTRFSISDHWRVVTVLLLIIVASAFVGLVQFSGTNFDNPLVNDAPWVVSGFFANRNHLALLSAIGCLLVPAWAFRDERSSRWANLAALALIPVLILIILATGSRVGVILGGLGLSIGVLTVWHRIKNLVLRISRRTFLFGTIGVAGVLAATVGLSVTENRAVSIDRVIALEGADDLRWSALPTVLKVVAKYAPAGSGYGTFDSVFRIDEPDELLRPEYFNHAHNDLIEVVLDGGLPGLILLGGALGWWLWMGKKAWRGKNRERSILPCVGWGVLLLVLLASAVDYPARTPLIMAIVVIAGVWLNGAVKGSRKIGA